MVKRRTLLTEGVPRILYPFSARLGLRVQIIISDGAGHFTRFRTIVGDSNWWGGQLPMIDGKACGMLHPSFGPSALPILVAKDLDHIEKNFWGPLTRSGRSCLAGLRMMWYDGVAVVQRTTLLL